MIRSNCRVLLVNMPFAGIGFPSIALGLFKRQFESVGVPCDVFYLNVLFAQMVGWDSYHVVEKYSALLAGEQMFARDLFQGAIPSEEDYQAEVQWRVGPQVLNQINHLKANVSSFIHNCLQRVPWYAYDIVGFSTLFEQNLASLSLAHRIKQLYPNKIIVFGGANCEDGMGVALHRSFPFVDFVCKGEANITFPELVQRLLQGRSVDDLPGIVYRANGVSIETGPSERVRDLDSLPFPDYSEYFQIIERTGAPTRLNRQAVIETARGCWWGDKVRCTFCGLNGENIQYRAKSPERALKEIAYLAESYQVKLIRAVDNLIPPNYFKSLLPKIAAINMGVDFFYEVRPDLDQEQIKTLANARVTNVQAGIENLSTNILKIMRKGTTGLRNIEFLKRCQQHGVYADWNMLFGFPGERAEDYRRAFELAELITHLKPPTSIGSVRMDRFSENFTHSEEMGFTNIRPWRLFKYVYPFDDETLMNLVYYFDYDHKTQIHDNGYMARLIELVGRWELRKDGLQGVRNQEQLIIFDTRAVASAQQTILRGIQASIYEYCDTRRKLGKIHDWLREELDQVISLKRLRMVLNDFVARKLMVEERGTYLSLAIMNNSRLR
jgi:ribosomal peptide maturation radical SAM protein 1